MAGNPREGRRGLEKLSLPRAVRFGRPLIRVAGKTRVGASRNARNFWVKTPVPNKDSWDGASKGVTDIAMWIARAGIISR